MRFVIRTLLVLFVVASLASSSVIVSPFPDRVRRSDAAVVGRLVEVDMVVRNNAVAAEGVIRIDEVIFGEIDSNRDIRLSWQNGVGITCPRVDHERQMGIRMLWLLTEDGDSYQAGIGDAIMIGPQHGTERLAEEMAKYPGCFDDERLSAVLEFLKSIAPENDEGNRGADPPEFNMIP